MAYMFIIYMYIWTEDSFSIEEPHYNDKKGIQIKKREDKIGIVICILCIYTHIYIVSDFSSV